MKLRWLIIVFLGLSPGLLAETGEFSSQYLKISFQYPPHWQLDTSSMGRIIITDTSESPGSVTIRRYLINDDEKMISAEDLYNAIAGLYDKLGIPDVTNQELTYTIDGGRADFDINFRQYNENEKRHYQKYLKGTVIKSLTGNQVFYMILAQAPQYRYDELLDDFNLIINSFAINEPIADNLYVSRDIMPYLQILLILALVIFFFARNRRIQKSRNPLGRDSATFWRCPYCRKVNHVELVQCSRCGQSRPQPPE